MQQRNIKLKAWDKATSKMSTVTGMNISISGEIVELSIFNKDGNYVLFEGYIKRNIIIIQFTELFDSNKKEIFEYDLRIGFGQQNSYLQVVQWDDGKTLSHRNGYIAINIAIICSVSWNKDKQIVIKEDMSDYKTYFEMGSACEIVGNIFENPELLKELNYKL